MFAVVDIAGKQFKVKENAKYYVPLLEAEPETELSVEKVLLYADEQGTKVGVPYLNDVKVTAKVLEHVRDEKVIVFKKKRRTDYRKKQGHRQDLTRIVVTKIG